MMLLAIGFAVAIFGGLMAYELNRLNQAIVTSDGGQGAKPVLPRRAWGVWIGKHRDPSGHPTFVLFAVAEEEARARALEIAGGRPFTLR